jgi:hypothetical protein
VRIRFQQFAAFAIAACSTACGGQSSVDASTQPSGGSSSIPAGGAAGASSSTTDCPGTRPTVGAACDYTGNQCNYAIDTCSSAGFTCTAGAWQPAPQLDGERITCSAYGPGSIPADGSSCLCQGTLDCSIADCTGQGLIHAVCDNTTWHITTELCTDTTCGSNGLHCAVGQVCVLAGGLGAQGPQYECDPDPCAAESETTSCECAASLCSSIEVCSATQGHVTCDCPTC